MYFPQVLRDSFHKLRPKYLAFFADACFLPTPSCHEPTDRVIRKRDWRWKSRVRERRGAGGIWIQREQGEG
jgi:hypothetical protein